MHNAVNIARQEIGGFVRWWISELRGLVPSRTNVFGERSQETLVLSSTAKETTATLMLGAEILEILPIVPNPSTIQVEHFRTVLQKRLGPSSPKEILELDNNNLFLLQVDYPLTAEPNLEKILSNEFDRLTPFKSQDVYWDWSLLERDERNKKLVIQLAVAKRTFIDEITSYLNAYGISPWCVRLRESHETFSRLLPMSAPARSESLGGLNQGINIVLLLSLLLLGGAQIYHLDKQDVFFAEAIKNMTPKIMELEKTKKNLVRLKEAAEALKTQVTGPSVLELLKETTHLIPDDTWIFDFRMTGVEVKLSGYSPESSKLIGLFDKHPMFSDVKFLSPVTTSLGGKGQRFEMSFQVGTDKEK